MGYYNQAWQDDRLVCTNLTLQVMMASSHSVQVTIANGFIYTSATSALLHFSS